MCGDYYGEKTEKNKCIIRETILSKVMNLIKRHKLIFALCNIYICLILVFGFLFWVLQDGFVIGESIRADKIRKQYIEYIEFSEELWYGCDLNFDKIDEDIIDDALVEIDLFEKKLIHIIRDRKNEDEGIYFPSRYSLSESDDDSKFFTYEFDDRIGNVLFSIISDDREVTFLPDLEPISSEMAIFYMELIEKNFSHYRIKDVYRGDYWLREYEIKTNTTNNEIYYEDVYYMTLELINENCTTNMYLIIQGELLGEAYEDIIRDKFNSRQNYLIDGEFDLEIFNYISQPDGQEGSIKFAKPEKEFLYSLISSNAAYMGNPMEFEEEEVVLNYFDCIFISAMYATTTGYADVIISSDFLKIVASVEAVVENGIILAMIVGLLTSIIEKRGRT